MARLSASYTFASGDVIGISLKVENDYPDALAESVKTIGAAMREVLISVAQMEDAEDEGEGE